MPFDEQPFLSDEAQRTLYLPTNKKSKRHVQGEDGRLLFD